MQTYPEMNARIVGILRVAPDAGDSLVTLYAALRIEQLEASLAAQEATIARLREALAAIVAPCVSVRRQWFRDHGMPEVADECRAYPSALAAAALAPTQADEKGEH